MPKHILCRLLHCHGLRRRDLPGVDRGVHDVLHKAVGMGGRAGFSEEIDPVVDLETGDRETGSGGGVVVVRQDGFLFVVERAGFRSYTHHE